MIMNKTYATYFVTCSKGTYVIRSLGESMANQLGSLGFLVSLD